MTNIDDIAKSVFGIEKIRDIQKLAIENILQEQNQVVILQTGGGKSLCFLLPALLLKGLTIIVYPLISLISDQKRRLDECNIKSCILSGSQSKKEKKKNILALKNGAKIILTTPETLNKDSTISLLKNYCISHIAIDEVHCVYKWGSSFRPKYLSLPSSIKKLKPCCVSAFTATASDKTLQHIEKIIFKKPVKVIRGNCDRENIFYSAIKTYSKTNTLLQLCEKSEKPLVVFCNTRKKTESAAREIAEMFGYDNVRFYHAGLSKKERLSIENWFLHNDCGIMCATCAYGMGIDKKDIRTIIHYSIPNSVEDYLQESGRAGRDRKSANAILLYDMKDIENDNDMVQYALTKECKRNFLLQRLGNAQIEKCNGCDSCNKINHVDMISDFAMRFIKLHRKQYTRNQIISIFMNKYYINLDTAKDVMEQLFLDKRIKECKGLWYGKIELLNRII